MYRPLPVLTISDRHPVQAECHLPNICIYLGELADVGRVTQVTLARMAAIRIEPMGTLRRKLGRKSAIIIPTFSQR